MISIKGPWRLLDVVFVLLLMGLMPVIVFLAASQNDWGVKGKKTVVIGTIVGVVGLFLKCKKDQLGKVMECFKRGGD